MSYLPPFHSTLSGAILAGCTYLALDVDATARAFEGFKPFLMPLPGEAYPCQTVTLETGRNARFVSFAHVVIIRTCGVIAPYEVTAYTSKCTIKEHEVLARGVRK